MPSRSVRWRWYDTNRYLRAADWAVGGEAHSRPLDDSFSPKAQLVRRIGHAVSVDYISSPHEASDIRTVAFRYASPSINTSKYGNHRRCRVGVKIPHPLLKSGTGIRAQMLTDGQRWRFGPHHGLAAREEGAHGDRGREAHARRL